MKRKTSLKNFLLGVAALSAVFVSTAASRSAAASLDRIVSRLQQEYEAISTVSADFTQETSGAGSAAAASAGRVFFKKPGMMKWVYRKPDGDELVSDGKTIWFFQKDLNQVMERPSGKTQGVATDFLGGIGNIRKEFDVTLARETGDVYRLGLAPKNRQAGQSLRNFYIEVDRKTFLVVRTIAENYFGTTTVSFSNISLNSPIRDSFFKFSPPKGAAVVRP